MAETSSNNKTNDKENKNNNNKSQNEKPEEVKSTEDTSFLCSFLNIFKVKE